MWWKRQNKNKVKPTEDENRSSKESNKWIYYGHKTSEYHNKGTKKYLGTITTTLFISRYGGRRYEMVARPGLLKVKFSDDEPAAERWVHGGPLPKGYTIPNPSPEYKQLSFPPHGIQYTRKLSETPQRRP